MFDSRGFVNIFNGNVFADSFFLPPMKLGFIRCDFVEGEKGLKKNIDGVREKPFPTSQLMSFFS